jgi:hypothetical protein
MKNNEIDKLSLMPLLIGFGLLLSISTSLRNSDFPIGPGEVFLTIFAGIGFLSFEFKRLWRNPVVIFWIFALTGMFLGAWLSVDNGVNSAHHSMAYAFTAMITIGMVALLMQLDDADLRRIIFWLCCLSAIVLWFGFFLYLYGDSTLLKYIRMPEAGDIRYSGWSLNPNQLALFFVPLPVWVAALWRNVVNPSRLEIVGFVILLFALMLMGLLVRSDGLFLVWIFEFLILIFLRLRWEFKTARRTLLVYALVMVLSVFLVKTFAHGEVRKSVRCAVQTISSGEGLWSAKCYDGQAFRDQEAFRIGYSNPIEKTDMRELLWKNGLQQWMQSPWVGFGPGDFSWVSTSDVSGQVLDYKESHNITIDLLTQGGLLAGASLVVLFLYLSMESWRIRDSYTFSVVLMMAAFTFFHNTRQPYFWFVLVFSYEAIRRRLFVSLPINKV